MNAGASSKKQAPCEPADPDDGGNAWVWRALALRRRLRVVAQLSPERTEEEATAFLKAFKARTDGRPPLFTSDKLPAYVAALVAHYSTPEPLPAERGRGRPRQTPQRKIEPNLIYAQVDKRREKGRVMEVRRRIVFGDEESITTVLDGQQVNTSYLERDNLTSRQSKGRLVRKLCEQSSRSRHRDANGKNELRRWLPG